jgi:esterase/lipase
MKNIFLIFLCIILFIICSVISFLLYNRDEIFYFLPKNIYNPNFEIFLKKYNVKKYESRIDKVDIIDIPPRKNSDKIIVFLHGNFGNIKKRDKILSFLSDSFKCRIISVDYLSGKEASIKHLLNITCDIIKKLVEDGIELENIILWGESIGCAMALETSGITGVKNVVMMAGFRKMRDMVDIILGKKLGFFTKLFVKELDNEKQIQKQKNLKLINLHSKDDDLIPYKQVKEMVKKLNLEHYKICGTHNDPIIEKWIIKKIRQKFYIDS